MGTNRPGSREHRKNERAAQERYNAPKDKAGRDYIARPMDMDKFRANYDDIFRKPRVVKDDELPPDDANKSTKVAI